ncbi:MAG: YwiC-like family protein, partial [Actinobacteria bacterium]|nr:YwiC-like family protein [Actinomycetota bacterium]
AALVTADGGMWWWPVLVAAPLVGVELWFDMRSRGRRLAPELSGAIGISAIAAMIVLASGGSAAIAVGAWLVLSARAVASIPFVRAQVFRLHGRPRSGPPQPVWDLAAVALLTGAVAVEHSLLAGAIAVLAVVAIQEVTALSPPPKATVQGIRQTIMGLSVVLVTWVGVLVWG